MKAKIVFSALALVGFLCGCGGSSGGSSSGTASSGTASFRVLNASQGVASVIVDGDTIGSAPYPMCVYEICETLSGYATVDSSASFQLEYASGTNVTPSQFQKLNLTNNSENTFILTPPKFNTGTTDVGFLLTDDSVPTANSVKIRIANVYPLGPDPLSAFILPEGLQPSGNPTVSNVAFGSASTYVTLPPGSYTVWFVVPAKTLGTTPPPYTTWGPTTYPANRNFTVYLMRQLDTSRGVILADN